jgi:hypothetical protein
MFPGYDPERRPPYSQKVTREINGKKYVVTYYVSNGYGGSISISTGPLEIFDEDVDEKDIDR